MSAPRVQLAALAALAALSALAALPLLAGCPAALGSDARARTDAATSPDAGSPGDAAASTDAAFPLAGFGAITGACDVIDDEIASASPAIFRGAIDFGSMPYTDADLALLSAGGQEIVADGNAGGSSLLSEVFAYEVLYRCERAVLLRTETEVAYVDPMGPLTDLLVEIDGAKLGVSVTRAVLFPFDTPFTVADAQALLEQKLQGVLDSTANVAPADAWVKQILHVLAYGPGHADSIEAAWPLVDPVLRADTIVFVTVTDGDDAFIY